jgi:hypothetical protein
VLRAADERFCALVAGELERENPGTSEAYSSHMQNNNMTFRVSDSGIVICSLTEALPY